MIMNNQYKVKQLCGSLLVPMQAGHLDFSMLKNQEWG
jgi:hypothetical protein